MQVSSIFLIFQEKGENFLFIKVRYANGTADERPNAI
jgi:hypothetical protein